MKFGQVININSENLGKNYPFENIKYVDISSVGEGIISDLEEIKVETAPSRAKRVVKSNNTIISTVRPQNRSFYYFKDTSENIIASTGFAVLSPKEDLIDGRYLFYIISDKNFTAYLANHEKGAAYPAITTDVIFNKEINLPPLQTQKRIASILSAYDDLIENNLKRIKLLEETAQNIYKEWFVNFRFPNYENTPFNKETGLPEGWFKGNVSDLCEVKSGYAFKSKDWQQQGNPVMKIKNITNNTVDINDCDYVDDEVAKIAEKYELFEGDVLIAMTGATVGKVGLIPKIEKRIYLNQRVGLFRPFSEIENNVYLVFSFFMTDEAQRQILNFAGGAAQPNISSSQISDVEINIGSAEILKMFESKIQPIMVSIQTLYSQNQKLKEARDILLPRLMNRTIEV
jgi:type I restriction enzyme S subunit